MDEAKASVNFYGVTKAGWNCQFTLRDDDENNLMLRFKDFVQFLNSAQVTPKQVGQPTPKDPPQQKIQMHDSSGLPVVDQEGNPVMENLPPGVHIFTISKLAHGKTKSGKDVLKVWINEEYEFCGKYGMNAFSDGGMINGWEEWPIDTPFNPQGVSKVIVRDPKDGGKYANIESFQ